MDKVFKQTFPLESVQFEAVTQVENTKKIVWLKRHDKLNT